MGPRTIVARIITIFILATTVFAAGQTQKLKNIAPSAQPATTQPATTPSASDTTERKEDPQFKGMQYRLVGPFRGGRSLTASGVAGDPLTYYFGSTGGGVW